MNKKKDIPQNIERKNTFRTAVRKKAITPLQTIAVTTLMTMLVIISVNSMITYGSDRRPNEDIFRNSQTVSVINQ